MLRKVQSSKTETGINRKYEQTTHKYWCWNCDWLKKNSNNKSRELNGFLGEFIKHLTKS